MATYISDINNRLSLAASPDSDPRWRVTDLISLEPARENQLSRVLGYSPLFHNHIDSVKDRTKKDVIICIGTAITKYKIYNDLLKIDSKFATLIHPLAYVSETAVVGDGAIICPFAFVGPFANIGENSVLNVQSSAGHDVEIGSSSVLSPGAMMNGHAKIGVAAFLGSGAIMNPKTNLGSFAQLAAGSVLTKSAGNGYLMHGNPAKGRQMVKVS